MRVLLDSHAALWWLEDSPRLGANAVTILEEPAIEALLSAATVWEIGIKRTAGKLRTEDDWADHLLSRGALALPVTFDHAAAAVALPPHHKDPFDRMLVAQAMTERAAIISRDARLRNYDVEVIW